MTNPAQTSTPGRLARWREHRRSRRQEALERDFFMYESACDSEMLPSAIETETRRLNAHDRATAYGSIGVAASGGFDG